MWILFHEGHRLVWVPVEKGGFWGVKFSVKASYSYQRTRSDKVDKSATLKVHVKAVQDEVPGGLKRMLDILESAVTDTPKSA